MSSSRAKGLKLYIFRATTLHTQYLLSNRCTMSIFITNYCPDVLRPQFLAIVRKLASSSTYAAYVYVVTYAEQIDFYTSVYKLYSFNLTTECLRLDPTTHFNWRIVSNTDVWAQNIKSMPNSNNLYCIQT